MIITIKLDKGTLMCEQQLLQTLIGRKELMSVAVRFFSRSGNTRAIAESIAEAAKVKAISADAAGAEIKEPVDTLICRWSIICLWH